MMQSQSLVRVYKGSQSEASQLFARDVAQLMPQGWVVVSQSYAPGSWGCGAFLIALALCIFLIGILVFIYMLIVKPAGVLTVTYVRQLPSAPMTGGPVCPKCRSQVAVGQSPCPRCGQAIDWGATR
jgi:hypothetical protein